MGHGSAAGSVPPVNAPLTPHSTRTTPQQDGNKYLKMKSIFSLHLF